MRYLASGFGLGFRRLTLFIFHHTFRFATAKRVSGMAGTIMFESSPPFMRRVARFLGTAMF